jgi:hypothetical protein
LGVHAHGRRSAIARVAALYDLGYTPVQLAFLFLFYEFFGMLTNLVGGGLLRARDFDSRWSSDWVFSRRANPSRPAE